MADFQDNTNFAAQERNHSLMDAFRCAWNGFWHTVTHERNMKIHVAVAVLAVIAGVVLRISAGGWCAVLLCIGMVFAAECFNTALEATVDLITDEYREAARVAKDCAAAAVAVLAVMSVIVGLVVYIPAALVLLQVG